MPIITSDDVEFYVANQRVYMKAGELWYINAGEIHAVNNASNIDRVHLVIDCRVNPWLRQQLT